MSKGVSIDGWCDRKAAADYMGVTDWWLEKWHANLDMAPPYIRHGRKVWYRIDDLRAWLANEAKTLRVREASGFTLDSIHAMGKRRADATPPPVAELHARYEAEHGPADVVLSREIWDRLWATFTVQQKRIYRGKLAVVAP